jgi:hypothetical protein
MMTNQAEPIRDGAALRKAELILQALEMLRAANAIDERDDLDAASWVTWFDRTMPNVTDVKILAGAMEIEMMRRRGEQIIKEGERRGGNTKVSRPETLVSVAAKNQRTRDRAVAAEPEAVKAFIERETQAGRVPSPFGAFKAASMAKAAQAPARRVQQMRALQTRTRVLSQEILGLLDQIADDTRRSDAQLAKITGDVPVFLQRVRLIPWLTIDRTIEGTVFRIDTHLRAICDGAVPRPELSYTSMSAYLRSLREEITRRRKENHDENQKRRWNSELILKREQTTLLDWIEQQLDRVPSL